MLSVGRARSMIDWKRVVVFRGLAVASGLSFVVHAVDETLAQWVLLLALVAAGPLFIHWCAEPAALERADESLERSTKSPWLVAMFAPGGGRAALLLVVSLAMVFASFLAARAIWVRDQALWASDDPVQLAMVVCYALIYVLVPSTLLAQIAGSARGRGVIRVTMVALFFVPAIWFTLRETESPCFVCDPFAMLNLVTRRGPILAYARNDFVWLVSIAGIAIAISLPRIINGVREVELARRTE